VTLDISSDYMLFDGVETVTFTAQPDDSEHEVAYCLRTRFEREEAAFVAGLGLESNTLPLNVPKAECGDYVPKAGDHVEDATGAQWTIQRVRYRQLVEMYRLILKTFVA
jgi:hypothetical protein